MQAIVGCNETSAYKRGLMSTRLLTFVPRVGSVCLLAQDGGASQENRPARETAAHPGFELWIRRAIICRMA